MVLLGRTINDPVDVFAPPVQPPLMVTVKLNVPLTEGDPLIVTTLVAHCPLTPVGKPAKVAPVAPVVTQVMGLMGVLMHKFWLLVPAEDVKAMVFVGLTIMLPVVVLKPPGQPPVIVTVYPKVPDTVGVPLMVNTLAFQDPVTPDGRPATSEPVAMVVLKVMLDKAVLIQTTGLLLPAPELKVIELFGLTIMVPVAFTVPQPPVKRIE